MDKERYLPKLVRQMWFGGASPPVPAKFLLTLLTPAEGIYRSWQYVKDGSYRRGWLKVESVSKPVISVGNLTTGGSGKTTFCLYLAAMISERGRRAAVVSHSYKADQADGHPCLLRGEEYAVPNWRRVGDEAAMMALAAPGLLVVCGKNKKRSLKAASKTEAEVIIIDDAFHRRDIRRNLDLLLVDARQGFGNGRCLPRGPLREQPSALSRADALIVTRVGEEGVSPEVRESAGKFNPRAPILVAREVVEYLELFPSRQKEPADNLHGLPVYLFCGLGNPDGFLKTVKRCGADVLGRAYFKDHHSYTEADLEHLARESLSLGAKMVLTTAKDAVKIGMWLGDAPPLVVLRVGFDLVQGQEWLEKKLDSICP